MRLLLSTAQMGTVLLASLYLSLSLSSTCSAIPILDNVANLGSNNQVFISHQQQQQQQHSYRPSPAAITKLSTLQKRDLVVPVQPGQKPHSPNFGTSPGLITNPGGEQAGTTKSAQKVKRSPASSSSSSSLSSTLSSLSSSLSTEIPLMVAPISSSPAVLRRRHPHRRSLDRRHQAINFPKVIHLEKKNVQKIRYSSQGSPWLIEDESEVEADAHDEEEQEEEQIIGGGGRRELRGSTSLEQQGRVMRMMQMLASGGQGDDSDNDGDVDDDLDEGEPEDMITMMMMAPDDELEESASSDYQSLDQEDQDYQANENNNNDNNNNNNNDKVEKEQMESIKKDQEQETVVENMLPSGRILHLGTEKLDSLPTTYAETHHAVIVTKPVAGQQQQQQQQDSVENEFENNNNDNHYNIQHYNSLSPPSSMSSSSSSPHIVSTLSAPPPAHSPLFSPSGLSSSSLPVLKHGNEDDTLSSSVRQQEPLEDEQEEQVWTVDEWEEEFEDDMNDMVDWTEGDDQEEEEEEEEGEEEDEGEGESELIVSQQRQANAAAAAASTGRRYPFSVSSSWSSSNSKVMGDRGLQSENDKMIESGRGGGGGGHRWGTVPGEGNHRYDGEQSRFARLFSDPWGI